MFGNLLLSLFLGRVLNGEYTTQPPVVPMQAVSSPFMSYYEAVQTGQLDCTYPTREGVLVLHQTDVIQNNRAVCLPPGEQMTRVITEPRMCDNGLCAQKVLTYTSLDPEEPPYAWIVVYD